MKYVITYFLKQGWNLPLFWTGKSKVFIGREIAEPEPTANFHEAKQFDHLMVAKIYLHAFKTQIANPNDGSKWKIEKWSQESFDKWYADADAEVIKRNEQLK